MNSELLSAIYAYHDIGLAIIPFYINKEGKKRPNLDEGEKWERWQTQPQTKAELEKYIPRILEKELFGIVTGTPIQVDGETYYYQIIDRDIKDPDLTEEIKEKSKQAINLMRTTKTIRTLSGGDHLDYYSRTQSKGKKLNKVGMEFLATGNLCVMPLVKAIHLSTIIYPLSLITSKICF